MKTSRVPDWLRFADEMAPTVEEGWMVAAHVATHAKFERDPRRGEESMTAVWQDESGQAFRVWVGTLENVERVKRAHRVLLLWLQGRGVFIPRRMDKRCGIAGPWNPIGRESLTRIGSPYAGRRRGKQPKASAA